MTFIPERMENLSAVSGWNDPGFFFFFFGRAVYTLISKLISLNLGGRQKKKKKQRACLDPASHCGAAVLVFVGS